MDNRTISIAIPTYQNFSTKTFEQVINDERVSEIVIIDDFSDEEIYYKWEELSEYDETGKIRLGRNEFHLGDEENRHRAIILSDNEWVLCATNQEVVIDGAILDSIYKRTWEENFEIIDNGLLFMNRAEYLITYAK